MGHGSTTITATQHTTRNYLTNSITASLTVAKADPSSVARLDTTKTYGDEPFDFTAPVSLSDGVFTYTSSNTAVATVSEMKITIVGAGIATITAHQEASGNYLDDIIPLIYLEVNKASPTITVPSPITKTYGNAPFILTAPTSNSRGAFTYTSSNTAVATISGATPIASGNTVTIVGAGSVTITATQAETSNYLSGTTTISLTVNKASPTITSPSPITKTYGDVPFDLTAPSSNSDGAFTYTSSNTAVATIVGNTVTIIGARSATITATQAETSNYLSRTTTISLTVAESTPQNPTNIANANGLNYLLTTNAKYANIQGDVLISKIINSNTTKKLATNTSKPKKITKKV
jgi:hypothetical protein